MNSGFALELKNNLNIDISTLEGCYLQIYQQDPFDEAESIYVFTEYNAIVALSNQFSNLELIEEVHELLLFEELKVYEKFSDYGWKGKLYYLYRELVLPFKIVDGEEVQIKMATIQMEEDLIAYDYTKQTYYVDFHVKELIEGYANAYEIHVEFL
ncbi:MAG: hypothetical protein LPK26_04570 [Bacillaceae bacterium]|nr:hypothetical protein [Bacillaceae bacterium]